MTTVNSLFGTLALSLCLSAAAYGQGNTNDAENDQSDEQLAQRFSQLDTNADGVLSLEEFRQLRGAGRGMAPPRGERMGQMTPEQREQMRERMQSMTPEQRERMREQMRERRGEEDQTGAHDHSEP